MNIYLVVLGKIKQKKGKRKETPVKPYPNIITCTNMYKMNALKWFGVKEYDMQFNGLKLLTKLQVGSPHLSNKKKGKTKHRQEHNMKPEYININTKQIYRIDMRRR